MTEVIKSVIWKKEDVKIKGKKLHKYLIGTILVTDEPIDGIIDGTDHVVMGEVDGENDFTNIFSRLEKFSPPYTLGELSEAMISISEMTPDELEPKEPQNEEN
jgi:hypothetical protein